MGNVRAKMENAFERENSLTSMNLQRLGRRYLEVDSMSTPFIRLQAT